MRSIVIGLVAPKRAGKQTFVTLLLRTLDRNLWSPSHKHFEFSAPLGLGLERLGLPKTRQNYQKLAVVINDIANGCSLPLGTGKLGIEESPENLQNLGAVSREIFGGQKVFHGMDLMLGRDNSDLKFADGMRWPEDETLIRSLPYSLVVYINASPSVRYERARTAANSKVGEQQMTWEEFLETERAPTEVNITEIGSRADFMILNDNGLDEYGRQVKNFYDSKLVPMVRNLLRKDE